MMGWDGGLLAYFGAVVDAEPWYVGRSQEKLRLGLEELFGGDVDAVWSSGWPKLSHVAFQRGRTASVSQPAAGCSVAPGTVLCLANSSSHPKFPPFLFLQQPTAQPGTVAFSSHGQPNTQSSFH